MVYFILHIFEGLVFSEVKILFQFKTKILMQNHLYLALCQKLLRVGLSFN